MCDSIKSNQIIIIVWLMCMEEEFNLNEHDMKIHFNNSFPHFFSYFSFFFQKEKKIKHKRLFYWIIEKREKE